MIRILRLMEYIYETPEDMIKDMSHWSVPANGTKRFNPHQLIHSATLNPSILEVEDESRN